MSTEAPFAASEQGREWIRCCRMSATPRVPWDGPRSPRRPLCCLSVSVSPGTPSSFSLADVYLFRNRPGIANPHQLAEVGRIDTGGSGGFYSGAGFDTFSYPNYLDYRERHTVFEGLAAYHVGSIATFVLGTAADAVRVSGAYVSMFSLLVSLAGPNRTLSVGC